MSTFKKILHNQKFKEPVIYDTPKDYYFWIGVKALIVLCVIFWVTVYIIWNLI